MHLRHPLCILVATVLTACASAPDKPAADRAEGGGTVFVAENISVTYSGCDGKGAGAASGCVIEAISSTSSAPTGGAGATNRRNAMDAACAYALANARHWMGERVESTRLTERVGTSTEKSARTGSGADGSGEPRDGMSLDAANDTRTTVRNVVRRNAGGYMTGWAPSSQDALGDAEVSCAMTWNRRNAELMRQATDAARR